MGEIFSPWPAPTPQSKQKREVFNLPDLILCRYKHARTQSLVLHFVLYKTRFVHVYLLFSRSRF